MRCVVASRGMKRSLFVMEAFITQGFTQGDCCNRNPNIGFVRSYL